MVITGYHALRAFAPAHLKTQEPLLDSGTSQYDEKQYAEKPHDEKPPAGAS